MLGDNTLLLHRSQGHDGPTVKIREPWAQECPVCHAPVGQPCRGKRGQIVDCHKARYPTPVPAVTGPAGRSKSKP